MLTTSLEFTLFKQTGKNHFPDFTQKHNLFPQHIFMPAKQRDTVACYRKDDLGFHLIEYFYSLKFSEIKYTLSQPPMKLYYSTLSCEYIYGKQEYQYFSFC